MMYGYNFSASDGWFMLAAMAIIAVAILGSVWLIVHRPGASHSSSGALEILRERFAKDEISGEQFEEVKKRVG
jgi:putative membrane protein